MKLFVSLVTVFFILGCSDNSGSGGVQDDQVSTGLPTISQLTGVYDVGWEGNEWYWVIREDGTISDYDYLGDDSGGLNCYRRDNGTIEDLGSGIFRIVYFFPEVVGITLTRGDININQDLFNASGAPTTYPRLSLIESDFTPLCD